MANASNRQASIDGRRVSLERRISIRVPRFDTFVTEYSKNISTKGMFIVSDNPQAPGTTFTFEYSVADDWKLIRGKAQVVWTRYRDEGPERPPGMGVRFLEIDAQSRRLIRWIVEKHIREGGKPFELDELRSDVDEALENVLDGERTAVAQVTAPASASGYRKAQPPPSVRSTATSTLSRPLDRRVWPLILTAVTVFAFMILLFWITEIGGGGPETAGDSSVQRSGSASGNGGPTPLETTGEAAPGESEADPDGGDKPTRSATGQLYDDVLASLSGWAQAWSDQDVDRYLSFYTESFVPDGGLTREQWQAQRRERLAIRAVISVSISELEVERLADDQVRAIFAQGYLSEGYSDQVRKVMILVREDEGWKIAGEQVLPGAFAP